MKYCKRANRDLNRISKLVAITLCGVLAASSAFARGRDPFYPLGHSSYVRQMFLDLNDVGILSECRFDTINRRYIQGTMAFRAGDYLKSALIYLDTMMLLDILGNDACSEEPYLRVGSLSRAIASFRTAGESKAVQVYFKGNSTLSSLVSDFDAEEYWQPYDFSWGNNSEICSKPFEHSKIRRLLRFRSRLYGLLPFDPSLTLAMDSFRNGTFVDAGSRFMEFARKDHNQCGLETCGDNHFESRQAAYFCASESFHQMNGTIIWINSICGILPIDPDSTICAFQMTKGIEPPDIGVELICNQLPREPDREATALLIYAAQSLYGNPSASIREICRSVIPPEKVFRILPESRLFIFKPPIPIQTTPEFKETLDSIRLLFSSNKFMEAGARYLDLGLSALAGPDHGPGLGRWLGDDDHDCFAKGACPAAKTDNAKDWFYNSAMSFMMAGDIFLSF